MDNNTHGVKLRNYILAPLAPLMFYILAAFLLNFTWESLHAPYLYSAHTFAMSFWPLMVYAAGVDTLLLLVIFLGGVLMWRDWHWFNKDEALPQRKDEALPRLYVVAAGIIIALIIEIKAVYIFQQWTYSDLMPTVLGIGLSPLVQLVATGLVALWVARRVSSSG